ncbi:hypothetical protein ACFLR4_02035 [Bacteroidota bacterium]
MKIIKYMALAIIGLILFSSCEEDFNPFGEFKEKYVVNCIVRCDTTFQMLTIDKNYVSETTNPYDNHEDPAVKGALVKFWYGDSVKIFDYAEVSRADTSRYTTPFSYYYSDNFIPPEESTLEMEIILQDGTRLTSFTKVPKKVTVSKVDSDGIIPPIDKDYIRIRWTLEITKQIYVPVLYIVYFKKENGVDVRYIKEVPEYYGIDGDNYIPVYPRASNNIGIIYEMDVIDIAMGEISAGDPDKDNYTIFAAIFEVVAADDFLSKYYASTNVSEGGFSIKVDETDFSNIDGGFGVLGSYTKSRHAIKLTHDYIESFGYIPGLTE